MVITHISSIIRRVKTVIPLAFLLIIINGESTFGPNLVLGYQQFFRVRPHDKEVIEEKQVELQCHVANVAGLVQWSKDGFLLGFDPDIPGWQRYSMIVDKQRGVYNLKIKNVKLDDEAEFQCQVGPAKDNKPIRSSARITVLVPPHEILLFPTNRAHGFNITKQKLQSQTNSRLEVREAERITLACNTSTLSKPETQLKWFRNGMQINKDSYTVIVKQGLGASGKLFSTSSTLHIYTRLDDHGVQYTCQGEHPALTKPIKSTITLSVLYPPGNPSIEGYTEGDVISSGDTLTLACISRGGNPPAKLIWYKDSIEVDSTYSTSGGRESTNTYSFTVLPNDNNAYYKCEASNDVTPHPLHAVIKLNVLFPPTKVEIIGPKQGKVGDIITLTCVAGPSNPAVEPSWVIDGRAVLPLSTWRTDNREGVITTTNITFTLTNQDPDTKTVSCSAVSELLKETMVQTVNIDILYPPGIPTIIGYKEGTDLREGELYRFQCVTLGGNPLPVLRWHVTGGGVGVGAAHDRKISALTSISGSGVSSELVLKPNPNDNGATYKCEATNPATVRPLIASITLSVLYISHEVTIKLKPKHPKTGEMLSLHCDSGPCNPLCQVHWYKNSISLIGQHDGVIETNTPFGGKSTRSKLRLNVTSKDDESVISCEAVNPILGRSVRENITLRVLFKPEFMVPQLQKFDVTEGSDISVNLSTKGNPSLITYTWWKDSVPLLEISDTTTTTILPNLVLHHRQHHRRQHQLLSRGPILEIKNVFREDAGEYDCDAANSEGSTKTTISINVLFGAIIVETSKLVMVNPRETAALFCLAVGNPMTDDLILWKRRGDTNFIRDERINVEIEKGKSILWISNVDSHRDMGEYECIAYNGIGEEAIEIVKLLVKTVPAIVPNATTLIVAGDDGESVKMKTTAIGVPPVHFKWINPQGEHFITASSDSDSGDANYFRYNVERRQIDDTHFESTLIIRRVTYGDLGSVFKCIAYNEKGESNVEIKLRKRGKPDAPQELTVINTTHNSAYLKWNPGFNGGLKQSFKVRFRKSGTASFDSSDETENNGIIIKGLDPQTEYLFSVFSKNGLGESEFGSESVRASTHSTEFDSSEALIDALNGGKSNRGKRSVSKILTIIVIVLGLFLIILNASLVICYVKWKRKTGNRDKSAVGVKNNPKYKDAINGEAILMKTLSEDDMTITASLMPMEDETPNTKHCEVLMMSDLNSTSSPSTTHVLLMKRENSSQEFKYRRMNSQSVDCGNCPDIIKSRKIEDYEMDTITGGTLPRQYSVPNANGSNGINTSSLRRYSCSGKIPLKSILKNGTIKSQPML